MLIFFFLIYGMGSGCEGVENIMLKIFVFKELFVSFWKSLGIWKLEIKGVVLFVKNGLLFCLRNIICLEMKIFWC